MFCAFGLRWRSDIALPPFVACSDGGAADIAIGRTHDLPRRATTRLLGRGSVCVDGIRFVAGDDVIVDMIDGDRVGYHAGPTWSGVLPEAFFGTIVALTLAWRGMLPFHACAVEVAGKAVLIAGPSGAGKSSLTAGLIAVGAAFVADDLSVVVANAAGFSVRPGRATLRLHRDVARRVDGSGCQPARDDPRGKWSVRPVARTAASALPLAGMLLLGGSAMTAPVARFPVLRAQLFRPRWLAAMPNHAARLLALAERAPHVPVIGFAPITHTGTSDQQARAHDAMALIDALVRS